MSNKHENSFHATIILSNYEALTLINNLSEALIRSDNGEIQFSVGMDYLHAEGDNYKVVFSTLYSMIETPKIGAMVAGREICDYIDEGANQ